MGLFDRFRKREQGVEQDPFLDIAERLFSGEGALDPDDFSELAWDLLEDPVTDDDREAIDKDWMAAQVGLQGLRRVASIGPQAGVGYVDEDGDVAIFTLVPDAVNTDGLAVQVVVNGEACVVDMRAFTMFLQRYQYFMETGRSDVAGWPFNVSGTLG